jgi:hypothetical protein
MMAGQYAVWEAPRMAPVIHWQPVSRRRLGMAALLGITRIAMGLASATLLVAICGHGVFWLGVGLAVGAMFAAYTRSEGR